MATSSEYPCGDEEHGEHEGTILSRDMRALVSQLAIFALSAATRLYQLTKELAKEDPRYGELISAIKGLKEVVLPTHPAMIRQLWKLTDVRDGPYQFHGHVLSNAHNVAFSLLDRTLTQIL